MKQIIQTFPCLLSILENLEQRKTMAYLKFSGPGYYDHPEELFLFELWEDLHNELDKNLKNKISLWDRYREHDQLDYLLQINDLLWNVEFEGRYMFDYYSYPEQGDTKTYEQLEAISPFRNLPPVKIISLKELGI